MKNLFFITMFVFISDACFSQDFISMKNGKRIEVIVTDISSNLVRFKLFSEPKGREYFVYKDAVSGIMYQNGRVETFNQSDGQVIESKSSPIEYQYQYENQYQNQQPRSFYQTQEELIMPSNRVERHSFSNFHIGLAFPSGRFADGDPDKHYLIEDGRGFASMGFTAGFKYYSPLPVENLSWVFGIEAFYNGINSDIKARLEDEDWYDVKWPMYFNFPVTLGLNYAIPLQENFKFYGEAAIGGNISIVTKWGYSYDYSYSGGSYDEGRSAEYTPAFGFAYGLEAGFFIRNKYSIGIRYNNLGSYKYKITGEDDWLERALPITNISVCFGIIF